MLKIIIIRKPFTDIAKFKAILAKSLRYGGFFMLNSRMAIGWI